MAKVTFIMPDNHNEGAGSFYQRPFLAYLFAKANNLEFVNAINIPSSNHYTPFEANAIHDLWGKIFKFLGEPTEVLGSIPDFHSAAKNCKDVIYNVPFHTSYHYLANLSTQVRETLLGQAREEFRRNIQSSFFCPVKQSANFVIAIHLRDTSKGDPPKSLKLIDWQLFSHDYGLPDNNPLYYAKLYATNINEIVRKHKILNPILHIHSTGNRENFSFFLSLLDEKINIKFFLNELAPYSFLDLVFADILVASHSSFSWLALLLRNGPSYIRKDFRHFTTELTSTLDEVLFSDNQTAIQKFRIKLLLRFRYWIFNQKLKRVKDW